MISEIPQPILKVKSWIERFVTQPDIRLGGFPPCPYAQSALLAKAVTWEVVNEKSELDPALSSLSRKILDHAYAVGIAVFTEPKQWPLSELNDFVQKWRSDYESQDLYLLRDHPEDPEVVQGVVMNQGEYLLFFVQRLSALQEARQELKDKGYYRVWSQLEAQSMGGLLPHLNEVSQGVGE